METDIIILKTNIQAISGNSGIRSALDSHAAIRQWTIDLEDCDKVLRVIAELPAAVVIDLVRQHGFECSEL